MGVSPNTHFHTYNKQYITVQTVYNSTNRETARILQYENGF